MSRDVLKPSFSAGHRTRSVVWFWISLGVMTLGLVAMFIELARQSDEPPLRYATADNSSIVEVDVGKVSLNGEVLVDVSKEHRLLIPWMGLSVVVFGGIVAWVANPRSPSSKPGTQPTIRIAEPIQGIAATRVWRVDRHGLLKSTYANTKWPSARTMSSELPAKSNKSGIYAYRLGKPLQWSFLPWQRYACGIVSLHGHCVGHVDGVIRAQAADCIVLVASPGTARLLQRNYDCPVVASGKPQDTTNRWLLTSEAAAAMANNDRIISSKTTCKDVATFLKDVNV